MTDRSAKILNTPYSVPAPALAVLRGQHKILHPDALGMLSSHAGEPFCAFPQYEREVSPDQAGAISRAGIRSGNSRPGWWSAQTQPAGLTERDRLPIQSKCVKEADGQHPAVGPLQDAPEIRLSSPSALALCLDASALRSPAKRLPIKLAWLKIPIVILPDKCNICNEICKEASFYSFPMMRGFPCRYSEGGIPMWRLKAVEKA